VPDEAHFRRLARLYASAPITKWFGASVEVADGHAIVTIPIRTEFLHAAAAVHGSVYFRALDDSAFFAANSRVTDVIVLTVSFTVQFIAPVSQGVLIATGSIVHETGRLLFAESQLRDDSGRLLATGTGTFTRTGIPLDASVGYSDSD
jgi:uncharacterized protein (TIGR00369 family)